MTNEQDSALVEELARALSIPQWHTAWDALPDREKDLYFMQAYYVRPILTRLTTEAHAAGVAEERARVVEAVTSLLSNDTDWDTSYWNQAIERALHRIKEQPLPSPPASGDGG